MYDPAVGRFLHVDPLAEKRTWVSTYNYVQNNPINRIDPTGALDEPPVNGLEFFADDTGLYYWNKENQNYDHLYFDAAGDSHQSTYKADEFKEPVGDYTIVFDLSGEKKPDEYVAENTISSIAGGLMAYLADDDAPLNVISDQEKYPGVEIYSHPNMNGAITLGNMIFTNPDMEGANTLDHEYGHYLDFKFHFQYNQSEYLKEIGVESFISATKATISEHKHATSTSEKRANRLGGAWANNRYLKNKHRD